MAGVAALGALVSSLTAKPSEAQTTTPPGGSSAQQCLDPALAVCSDGQVIAILRAANQGEVDVAESVVNRVSDAKVKALAETIISDHNHALDQLDQLITKTGIEPVENDNSEEIAAAADQTIASLKSKKGKALDRDYAADEILDHIQTIGVGDHLLVPSAKNAQLKALLTTLRPTLVKHLQLANQAQTSVSGACGGTTSASGGDAGTAHDAGAAHDGGASGTTTRGKR
jgi:putative membrane protein